jgi:hypothetical protein
VRHDATGTIGASNFQLPRQTLNRSIQVSQAPIALVTGLAKLAGGLSAKPTGRDKAYHSIERQYRLPGVRSLDLGLLILVLLT